MNINDYKDVNGNVLVSETLVSDLIGDINTHKAENVNQKPHGMGNIASKDYEEGVWTPGLVGLTTPGTPTYINRAGFYTKVGRVVTISGRVDISSKGGLGGYITIAGLPFVGNSSMASQGITIGQMGGLTFGATALPTFNINANSSYILFTVANNGGSPTLLAGSNMADNFDIRFSATYMTN